MSRCGANVDYGNATLMDVETKQFIQTCEYDPSNTDLMYHKFHIQVAASIHEDDNYFFGLVGLVSGPGSDGTIAALKLNAIQAYFMTPRREFVYRQGDVELLRAYAAGSETIHLDVNNGPKPMECKVTHFAGFKAYRIEWTIEVCKILCAPDIAEYITFPDGSVAAVNSSQVISNRWEIEESRDSDWYFTRRLSGQLRVQHWRFIPHAYRYLCVPPLMPNFRRETQRFIQSKDGLSLDWEVVDKQRFAAPPSPAIDWDCKHEERTGVGGAMGAGSVSVKLWGAIGTPKRQLFQVAAQIILDRVADLIDPLAGADGEGTNSVIPQEMRIVDTLQDNVAEMHLTYSRVPQPETFINTIFKRIGEPIDGVNHSQWPNPIPYDGNSPTGMFAVYLQNPCTGLHGVPTGPVGYQTEATQPKQETTETSSDIQVFEGETSGSDLQSDAGKRVSAIQLLGTSPYTWYELESRYRTDTGVRGLPFMNNNSSVATQDEVQFFSFHRGLTKRVIYVKAERIGEYPALPFQAVRVDDNGITETMLERDIIPMAPALMADGVRYKFRLEAELVYGLSRTPALNEKLTSGSIPWDTSTKQETVFIPTAYQDEGIA